jgi:hypothetical protein
MQTAARYKIFRLSSSALAFILLWMSGIVALSHTDNCDDFYSGHAGTHQLTDIHPAAGPDRCIACAWNDAVNIYLPVVARPPLQTANRIQQFNAPVVRQICPLLSSPLTRGPPSVA